MPTLVEDTIAAISTPLGKSGIGVVRLSGNDSLRITESVFLPRAKGIENRVPTLGSIWEPGTQQIIDEVLVIYFRGPRSFTREDIVEISCHGSPVILKGILEILLRSGARLATPGEFTLRAFLRGRIDLVQAEAIRDLIEAKTLFQAKVAHQQAVGSLSNRLKPNKEKLVRLISLLEAGIDFAEDDVAVLPWDEIQERTSVISQELSLLHSTFSTGKIVTAGWSIAIVGRPNVGKSSLFNAFLNEERAIVTEIPGTTRDMVAETTEIRGIPVRFLDTAGIRAVHDRVEQIGINKSLEVLADADHILFLLDGSECLRVEDYRIGKELRNREYHLVINKADLPQRIDATAIQSSAKSVSYVSALTGQGMEALKENVFKEFDQDGVLEREGGFITNMRHETLIRQAVEALCRADHSLGNQMPHEVLLLDFYAALQSLNALTGETTVDDILNNIFSTFCIGK